MSRRKQSKGNESSGEDWLATYADTITLVLTFFVLLYSFSTIDAIKFKQVAASLSSVLSGQNNDTILDFNMDSGLLPVVGDDIQTTSNPQGIEELYEEVVEFVANNNLQDNVEIQYGAIGVTMVLKDNVLFDSGKADIKPTSTNILDDINTLIYSISNDIIIEGHTDNVPINTKQFPSNWELSTQRAVNVLKYFVNRKGANPIRFTAAGYGEYHPIAPNDSYTNKAKNRRVNIIISAAKREN